MKNNPELSLTVLLGFVLLLRPGEVLTMRIEPFRFLSKDLMSVKVWGKNSARTGEWESVLLKDPVLIQIIVNKQKAGEDYLFNNSSYAFNKFYREAVDHYRVEHRKPTPHGVRRGGATWHFGLYGSYDKTQDHGRWNQLKSARLYIDLSTTATAEAKLVDPGPTRLHDAQLLFQKMLLRFFPSPSHP